MKTNGQKESGHVGHSLSLARTQIKYKWKATLYMITHSGDGTNKQQIRRRKSEKEEKGKRYIGVY